MLVVDVFGFLRHKPPVLKPACVDILRCVKGYGIFLGVLMAHGFFFTLGYHIQAFRFRFQMARQTAWANIGSKALSPPVCSRRSSHGARLCQKNKLSNSELAFASGFGSKKSFEMVFLGGFLGAEMIIGQSYGVC